MQLIHSSNYGWFPKIVVPFPPNHPFLEKRGFFQQKTHLIWGVVPLFLDFHPNMDEKTTIQVEAHPAFAALLRTVEQQAEVIETKTKRGDWSWQQAAWDSGWGEGEGVDFGALDLLL